MTTRSLLLLLLVPGLLVATACTGTRTREFTRESYAAPGTVASPARVFDESRDTVWEALVRVLAGRGAERIEPGAETFVLRAALPWASAAEAIESVDLGRVRRVVSRTERSYRSTSPLDWRCNECVVRNGKMTGQRTELVEDVVLALDPARYRIEAMLRARVEPVRSGTRVELSLELAAEPADPPGLAPASTGRLEAEILASLARKLAEGAEGAEGKGGKGAGGEGAGLR